MASVVVLLFFSIFVGSLAASPQSSSIEAIRAIDTDGNGRVSLQEIEAFGRTSGLTSQEIRTDFKELDSNGNGELDPEEMTGLLSPSPSVPATAGAKDPLSAEAKPVLVAMAGGNGESIAAAEAHPVPAARAEPVLAAKAEPVPAAEALPVVYIAKTEPAIAAEAKLATAAKAEPALPSKADGIPRARKEQVSGLEALELDAHRQASAIVAAGLAQRAQALIQQGNKDAKLAELTEAKAVSLRGSASAAAQSMGAESLSASKAAVNAAAKQGLVEAERLKGESEELEKEAVQHHERAKQALLQASQAQMS